MRIPIATILTWLLLVGSAAIGQEKVQWKEETYFDFRGKPMPDALAMFQVPKDGLVKLEPEGLRITLPNDWTHPYGGIGVRTKFGIQGDFEITTTFEILTADEPPSGYGVGVTLRIHKAEPSKELANVSRLHRAKGRQIVLWNRSIELPGEKPKYPEGPTLCGDKIGRLRLARTGPTLHFLWAPSIEGDDFRDFKQIEFGADDIRQISLIGQNGRQPAALDARFLDLRIRSGGMRDALAEARQAPATSPEKERDYWWLISAAVVAGLLGAAIVIRRVMQRRPVVAAPSVAGSSDAAADASGDVIAAQCPHCQRRVKVRAALAGKKVKCPGCAASFAV